MKLLLFILLNVITINSLSALPGGIIYTPKEPLLWPNADTVPDISCLVYKVPLNGINVFDPETQLNSETINFSIPELHYPINAVELRLMIDHHPLPKHIFQHSDSVTRDEQLLTILYKAIGKSRLAINGQLFTGTIRLYRNTYWYNLGRRAYPALSLIINSYVDGVLQKSQSMDDMGSLCYDVVQARPS